MIMRRIVVVGGSIAAVTAAETLRLEGFDGEVTVVSQESVAPYTRVPLSKAVLGGRENLEDIGLPALSDDIELLLGVQARGLDVERRLLHTNGDSIPWDGAVLATGARARRLAPELRELVMRDVGDCITLREELEGASSVLVVGGGVLGMEIASTLRGLGRTVTVLDREPPMARLVGETVAARVQEVARDAGVEIHVDSGGVTLFGEPGERPSGARTASGRVFEADLVITAAGDVPNIEGLADSGLKAEGGVLVDGRCRVRRDIVAAGDMTVCATAKAAGGRLPTWTNAVDQARAAARALLRGEDAATYQPAYYFWTEQFGLDIKISGPMAPECDLVLDDGWHTGEAALLRWGPEDAPRRVLGWNHHLRPEQLKRMTRHMSIA